MRKLRHYTFIDNTYQTFHFFAEAERMKKYNLSTAAARKKNTRSRSSFPCRTPLSSLKIWSGSEGGRGRKESLFKGLCSWKEVLGKKKAKAKRWFCWDFGFPGLWHNAVHLSVPLRLTLAWKLTEKFLLNQLAVESYDKVARAAGYNSRFSRVVFQTCAFGNFIVPAFTLCVERVTCSLVPLPSMTSNFWIMIFIHVC